MRSGSARKGGGGPAGLGDIGAATVGFGSLLGCRATEVVEVSSAREVVAASLSVAVVSVATAPDPGRMVAPLGTEATATGVSTSSRVLCEVTTDAAG